MSAIRTDRTYRKALHSLALCLTLFPYAVKAENDEKPWIMNSIATCCGAIGLAALTTISPQKSHADGIKGTEFMGWSQTARTSYLQTSMTMATLVVAQTNPKTAACIENWYLGDPTKTSSRLISLENTIGQYPDYHPSAVILVVLKNECGSFK